MKRVAKYPFVRGISRVVEGSIGADDQIPDKRVFLGSGFTDQNAIGHPIFSRRRRMSRDPAVVQLPGRYVAGVAAGMSKAEAPAIHTATISRTITSPTTRTVL